MSEKIQITRLDGGVLAPSITWRQLTRKQNGLTAVFVFEGSGPSFEMDDELRKMRGVITKWGAYKDHTIIQGAPGIYDQVSLTMQAVLDPPVYLYDFKAPTKAAPLPNHPSYKTYWDHDIVGKVVDGEASYTIDNTEANAWQLIGDASFPDTRTDGLSWKRSNQALAAGYAVSLVDAFSPVPTSGHDSGAAKKDGINSYLVPSIIIRETVYFVEKEDFTMDLGPITYTQPALNTKSISGMSGKAGWPLRTTFGYPRDVYSLLNDSAYSDFKQIGTDNNGVNISLQEKYFIQKGIPVTNYITPNASGIFKGQTFGHPLWFCRSVDLKKTGYWYQATLDWEYFNYGVDADVYPLATARVNGLA